MQGQATVQVALPAVMFIFVQAFSWYSADCFCLTAEICTSGSPPELCPVDIHTEVGVCPDVPAGQQCNPGGNSCYPRASVCMFRLLQ